MQRCQNVNTHQSTKNTPYITSWGGGGDIWCKQKKGFLTLVKFGQVLEMFTVYVSREFGRRLDDELTSLCIQYVVLCTFCDRVNCCIATAQEAGLVDGLGFQIVAFAHLALYLRRQIYVASTFAFRIHS
jgi:hypothetical protein